MQTFSSERAETQNWEIKHGSLYVISACHRKHFLPVKHGSLTYISGKAEVEEVYHLKVKTGGEEAVFPPEDFKAHPNSNILMLLLEVNPHLHIISLPSPQLQHEGPHLPNSPYSAPPPGLCPPPHDHCDKWRYHATRDRGSFLWDLVAQEAWPIGLERTGKRLTQHEAQL